MPILHENDNEFIYNAIINKEDGPKYIWNENLKVYKYSNSKYPNKNYQNTFDPKSLGMKRGDVIHFGNDSNRNHNKLIFDGEKLQCLWTDVDDYGSVPPTFVCGDEPNDFNIGEFREIIDHNEINWLSKQKLKEIEVFIKNDEVCGKVEIKGKIWNICIDFCMDNTFNTGYGHSGSRKFKCEFNNNMIKIHKKSTYVIDAEKEEQINDLKLLVKQNNDVHIIHYYRKASKPSQYENEHVWFLFHFNSETKYIDMTTTTPNFPIIWRKVTKNYTSEIIIFDQKHYDNYIKSEILEKELDNIYICEVTGYTVYITMILPTIEDKLNCVKQHINKLIENYDNINKRRPFNYDGDNCLQMDI